MNKRASTLADRRRLRSSTRIVVIYDAALP